MPSINTHLIGRVWEVMEYPPSGDTKYWRTTFKLDWLDKVKDGQRLHTIPCTAFRKLEVYSGDIVEVWGEKGLQRNQATGKWEDKINIAEATAILFPVLRDENGNYPDSSVTAGQNKQEQPKPQGQKKTRPQQQQAPRQNSEPVFSNYDSYDNNEAPF